MTITYGSTQKAQDETLCKTHNHFTLRFSGRGGINAANTWTFRLRRENGHQAFYIPAQTTIYARLRCMVSNATDAYANTAAASTDTLDHISGNYCIYRDLGGNVVVGIDPATPQTEALATVVPTANTTVQGFEVVVAAVTGSTTTNTLVYAELDCCCVYEPEALVNFPAGATSALTTAG